MSGVDKKQTLRLNSEGEEDISKAVQLLKEGKIVAVPTETVYGLAADCRNGSAVEVIYTAKGRPEKKPLSVLVAGMEMVEQVCKNIPPEAYQLAKAFWPGPLTMVLESAAVVAENVTAGGDTLGVRCPDHAAALEVIRRLGFPLAAPSANTSSMPSPKSASEVLEDLGGKIDACLDGGACTLAIESTIVALNGGGYTILRQGILPAEKIHAALSGEEGR